MPRRPVMVLGGQLVESLGAATQYTVISFVVDYVIDPEHDESGQQRSEDDPDYFKASTVFVMMGAALLGCQVLSIPAWLQLVKLRGKYQAYMIWCARTPAVY
jgi:hypothetical protein